MSLDGNRGKSGQTNLIFFHDATCWCSFVYVRFCHLMACLLQGIAGILHGFLPIYPTGLGEPYQDSGAGCPYC